MNKTTSELKRELRELKAKLDNQKSDSSCKSIELKARLCVVMNELKERGTQYKKQNLNIRQE